jgi:hypothetical protein
MDTLRSAAHLQRELGDELFTALVSSDNTGAVRELAEKLFQANLPAEITVHGRTYAVLSCFKKDEKSVVGRTMVERAKEMNTHLGKDDRKHILKYQDEIPALLRSHVAFVFTDDRDPDNPENVLYVCWSGGCWVEGWLWLDGNWYDFCRVLRRK